jgi:hypothetical protein
MLLQLPASVDSESAASALAYAINYLYQSIIPSPTSIMSQIALSTRIHPWSPS